MVQKSTAKKPSGDALHRKKTKKVMTKRRLRTIDLIGEFEKFPFRPDNKPTQFPKTKRVRLPVTIPIPTPIPVRHIVIHSTGTPLSNPLVDLDSLPYHFVITKYGRLINIRELKPRSSKIEIALIGGKDKSGKHCDTRTKEQNEALFGTLVMLTEFFPKARIVGADKIYVYNHVNPGFDVKEWLGEFIPEFLQNAA